MNALRFALVFTAVLSFVGCSSGGTTNTYVTSPVAVSSVYPAEARAGETITVAGQNFGASQGTSSLSVNGVPATSIASWTDSKVVATVPARATSGNVTVTVDGVAGAPGYLTVPWTAQNADNVEISAVADAQVEPHIASDGAGGAIVVWEIYSNGNYDIYAQRVNSAGQVQWAANGVTISTATNLLPAYPQLIADGTGGAIITWQVNSNSNYDIYAQRVNSAGQVQWVANGVAISATTDAQVYPQLTADGAGGAIIAWSDNRNASYLDIYAQRVNSAGQAQWAANGVPITTFALAFNPQLTTDGAGGAIIAWHDNRATNLDIYAQRVNSAGQVQWTPNGGVMISTASNDQSYPQISTDGAGGAIIAWTDNRAGNLDIYAQRVNNTGQAQWTADGVAISTATGNQDHPQVTGDGAGGAIISWADTRNINSDIYAQRINSAGQAQWTVDGLAISTTPADQIYPQLTADGAGGAVIAWSDNRNGNSDIYAQRVSSAGQAQWAADGMAISTASNDQLDPEISSDGAGGAIIAWYDKRTGVGVYAQGVTASGRQ